MSDTISHLIPPALNDGAATPSPIKQKWKDMGDGTYALVLAVDSSSLPTASIPISGGSFSVAAGVTAWFPLGATAATGAGTSGAGNDPTNLASATVQDAWIAPAAGTFSALYTYCNVAAGGGQSYTVTVHKNGAATALTVAYGAADTSKNDLVNSFSVAAGDRVAVKIVASAGAAGSEFSWGLKFVPS